MNYWLLKSEPSTYSFSDLLRDKKTMWDGVRNFQARNNIKNMKKGDQAFFYHSGADKAVVGVVEITDSPCRDASAKEGDWAAIQVKPIKAFKTPVSLATIKQTGSLKNIALIKQSRLSVMPVTENEFEVISKLGG